MVLSFAFIGFGRALRSGTLDAWFVENFKAAAPNVDIQPALAKAQWANAMGLAIGAVIGGLLPDVFGSVAERLGFSIYDVSYAASFGVMLGVFIYTMFAIVETSSPLNTNAIRQGFLQVPSVIKVAGLLAVRHRTLSLLLAVLVLLLMATNPVEIIWPTHAKPMLQDGCANTVIGLLTAIYFFSIALGAALSPQLSRIFKRQHAATLAATCACITGVQVALALQDSIFGFAAVFILYSILLGACETPASSILHSCVQDNQRSTMLSLRSLIQQMGAALGLVFTGAIADIFSTPVAWIVGAAFLLVATALSLVLVKQLASSAQ